MTPPDLRWPASTAASLLAALTTWVALWSWAGFVERPSGFLLPALGACLIVAVSGMLLRSARLPSLLVAPAQLAVLLVWLNRTWAADLMYAGWVPTADSLNRVGARVQAGAEVSRLYAAPVPESAPAIYALLVVAGAGAAVLVDFLGCGLRRVPLAGLPLLAVYTAPLSILDGGTAWWVFAACALTFLFFLANDESRRLTGWGRQLRGSGQLFDSLGGTVNAASVRTSARKIGFAATGLAVVVPIFIPTLGTSLFGGDGPGSGGDGDSVSISNPMVDLKRDLSRGQDVDLVQFRTPDRDPSYLRISVLDSFDGETWKPSGRHIPVEQRAQGPMPRPPGLDPSVPRTRVPYSYEITSAFESRWLPTPYPVAAISAPGDWRYDSSTLDVISATDGQTTQDLAYSLERLRINPDPAELADAAPVSEEIFTPNTELPDSMPGSVRGLAREITAEQDSRFAMAVRLQEWFRADGGFTYSLDRAAGNGVDELEVFLGNGPNSRIGYCEQFAAAMALMVRSLGIPSRVAVGFLRPDYTGDNTYVYSSHDLHAWPEMYFEGTGWVRFEPTPPGRTGPVPGYTDREQPSDTPTEQPTLRDPLQEQNRFDDQAAPPPAETPGDGGAGTGGARGLFVVVLGAALVLLLVTGPRLARAAVRRRRWARAGTPVEAAEAAWSEVRDSATDLGVPWDDSVTLRSRARSLVASFGEPRADAAHRRTRAPATGTSANPEATAALERLVKLVERARYARSVQAPEEDLPGDVDLCVQALRDGATAGRRARADWLPASLTRTLGSGLEQRRRARVQGAALAEPGVDHAV